MGRKPESAVSRCVSMTSVVAVKSQWTFDPHKLRRGARHGVQSAYTLVRCLFIALYPHDDRSLQAADSAAVGCHHVVLLHRGHLGHGTGIAALQHRHGHASLPEALQQTASLLNRVARGVCLCLVEVIALREHKDIPVAQRRWITAGGVDRA